MANAAIQQGVLDFQQVLDSLILLKAEYNKIEDNKLTTENNKNEKVNICLLL